MLPGPLHFRLPCAPHTPGSLPHCALQMPPATPTEPMPVASLPTPTQAIPLGWGTPALRVQVPGEY